MTKTDDRRRNLRIALALTGLSVMLGACNTTGDVVTTQTVPTDYRQRHPIAVQEAKRSIVIFVGKARGGLSAAQHADVAGIAGDWVREGTGSVVVDVPVDTANSRAALPRKWRVASAAMQTSSAGKLTMSMPMFPSTT